MKTPLTFLLALTFLFLFSGSSVVFGGDWQDATDAFNRKDYKTVHRLLTPLAEQGDASAQYNLGQMYRKGEGVPLNYKEAAKWYRLAAEQGDASAQFNLGKMYFKAQVPLNYKEAAKWYRLAADQGHGSAQNNLGWMYREGEGVPQDYVLAHMWFNLAASNSASNPLEGLTEKLNRNTVEKKMTPSQIEKAKEMAINWKPKTQKVRVRPLEELDSELEPAVVTDEELVKKIIIIMGCDLCHKIPGIDFAVGILGPALSLDQIKSSFNNPNYKGKAKDLREYIEESILNPSAYVVFNDLEGETYPNIHPSNHFGQMLSDKALNKIVDFLMK